MTESPPKTFASTSSIQILDTAITNAMEMIETGNRGGFFIEHLPSGRFLLGVIKLSSRYPDRTPPTYYPGVTDSSAEQPIVLGPNEIKAGLVLKLPPPREFRRVRVHLKWPDGPVPARGVIDAYMNAGTYLTKIDMKDGVFDLQLLQEWTTG